MINSFILSGNIFGKINDSWINDGYTFEFETISLKVFLTLFFVKVLIFFFPKYF